jgi:hypothetical protein
LPEEEETGCFHDKFFEFIVLISEDPFCSKRLSEFAKFLADQGVPAESQLWLLPVAC